MKKPTIRFVFDRKKIASKKRKGLVQLALSHKGKRVFISTGIKLFSNQWHEAKRVIASFESVEQNKLLAAIEERVYEYVTECTKKNAPFSLDECVNRVNGATADGETFLDFTERLIIEREDITEGTRKNHLIMLSVLREFGKITTFESVNVENVTDFDNFLHRRRLQQTSIHGYHKRLKTYINKAYKMGRLTANPYDRVTISRGKSENRRYLTTEEQELLRAAKLSTSLDAVRDLFVFQSYTGLAYSDLAKFNFKKDVKEEEGLYIIKDRRQKTNEDYTIMLLPPAVEVLKKHGYTLPIISNSKYNLFLKAVAEHAGIATRLTTHVARHTFAVNAINSGVPIEVVAKMLGHADIKTTQIYSKITDKSVREGYLTIQKKMLKK